jgi:hypothetical protein
MDAATHQSFGLSDQSSRLQGTNGKIIARGAKASANSIPKSCNAAVGGRYDRDED